MNFRRTVNIRRPIPNARKDTAERALPYICQNIGQWHKREIGNRKSSCTVRKLCLRIPFGRV